MRRLIPILVFLYLGAIGTAARAAEPFDIEGIQITLGMPEETALKALNARFSIRALEGGGDWIVLDQKGDKVGAIQSKKGKIFRVSRDWIESNSEDSRKLADRLFSALANIASKEGTLAKIVTREIRSPDLSVREIQIVFPGRRVWVTLTDKYGVTVGEAIE